VNVVSAVAPSPAADKVTATLADLTSLPVDETPTEIASLLAAARVGNHPRRRDGSPVQLRPMLRTLKRTAERAGLDPTQYHLHKFRATFATTCLQKDVDL
jgi:hypothetical protein